MHFGIEYLDSSNQVSIWADAFLELLHTTRMTADIGVGTPLGHSLSDETFNEEKVPDVPKGSPPR